MLLMTLKGRHLSGSEYIVTDMSDYALMGYDGRVYKVFALDEAQVFDDVSENRLSAGQIRWLFANGCVVKAKNGSLQIDWDAANEKGFNATNLDYKE